MRRTFGEVPYPAGAARVLTEDCTLYVEGPFAEWQSMRYVAFAVDGFSLIAWRSGFTADEARGKLLEHLESEYGLEVVS